ncbi:hypothetical protein E0K99_00115 [Faecalicoccus pleomorphus]|uniref:hypothetical protein n=1 Tax=Faecalicoccus pleomorphus TaxID=1323 RepID=UPI001430F84C|nr:hypothetical protein [Faecalicoccus pleomorphus]NJE39728.1 hypothetical protein [Faecalicoccus pleomorphus]
MKVLPKTLLLLAGIVWFIAGGNVTWIGIQSYADYLNILHLLGSSLVFIFFLWMFSKIVQKHSLRIQGYTSKQPFYFFFDRPSFIMMAFMMSMGIIFRVFHLVSFEFIAVFYTGLGLALCLAGLQFMLHFYTQLNRRFL